MNMNMSVNKIRSFSLSNLNKNINQVQSNNDDGYK